MKKKQTKTDSERFSYEEYVYVLNLLEKESKKLESNYLMSMEFMEDEPFDLDKKSNKEKAYDIYRKKLTSINRIKEKFNKTVSDSYKDHPNKEMRKFWGV